jgi:hypothetical protein
MKRCSGCLEVKLTGFFSADRLYPDGLNYKCKNCDQMRRRSHNGHARQMYGAQKSSSRSRGHPQPAYSFDEFFAWLGKNGYDKLHADWVASGYEKKDAPSADRLDDDLSYSFCNIRLVRWDENCKKMGRDFVSGRLINQHTPVRQLTMSGEIVAEYVSQNSAGRANGIKGTHIGSVCLKRPGYLSAGGFLWEFADVERLFAALPPQAPATSTGEAPRRPLVGCAAARDGDCTHPDCPQFHDKEPQSTGRHCPLDTSSEE